MPRKKMVNQNMIPLKNMDQSIIERKNCLGVKLMFTEPFSATQGEIVRSQFKCALDKENITLTRNVKNSWKGLIMLLVTLSFCKYGNKAFGMILDAPSQCKPRRTLPPKISSDYEIFLSEDEQSELRWKAQPRMDSHDLMNWVQKNQAHEEYVKNRPQKVEQNLRRLYAQREPDPTFENLVLPEYCRPHYIAGTYHPEDIESCLAIFSRVLALDTEKSVVNTVFSNNSSHVYASRPAVYIDDPTMPLRGF